MNSANSTAPGGTGLWGTEPPDSDTAPLSSPRSQHSGLLLGARCKVLCGCLW